MFFDAPVELRINLVESFSEGHCDLVDPDVEELGAIAPKRTHAYLSRTVHADARHDAPTVHALRGFEYPLEASLPSAATPSELRGGLVE
jgi:hypothetical protein